MPAIFHHVRRRQRLHARTLTGATRMRDMRLRACEQRRVYRTRPFIDFTGDDIQSLFSTNLPGFLFLTH